MNNKNQVYLRHHLVNEMLETVSIIRDFESRKVETKIPLDIDSRIMLTGEGSSRIFPAKNIRHHSLMLGKGPDIFTEGSLQLLNYKLDKFTIIGASNSGKTKEIVHLFRKLGEQGHKALYSITCNPGTPLESLSQGVVSLDLAPELAVAATKSVVAQALVYECLLKNLLSYNFSFRELSEKFQLALTNEINPEIISAFVNAGTIFFSGYNNGVAEELTLKTNEILRKKSGFLPGTYLLHGIEEVIQKNDIIILVDPVESEFEKIRDIYSKNIGATVIAITNNASPFYNILVPQASVFEDGYLKLASGWNLLVEAGIKLGVQLDKPVRARKIGNEYIEAI
jgi:glucosamine--fructose-6-phosphate aminotransferase (isomerizing)